MNNLNYLASKSDTSFIISIQQIPFVDCGNNEEFRYQIKDFFLKNQSENLQIVQSDSDDKLVNSIISDSKTKSAPDVLMSYHKSTNNNCFNKDKKIKHHIKVIMNNSDEETLKNSDCTSLTSCETCDNNENIKEINLKILLNKLSTGKNDEKSTKKQESTGIQPRFMVEELKYHKKSETPNQNETILTKQRKCFLDFNGFSLKESQHNLANSRNTQELHKKLMFKLVPLCKDKEGKLIANFIIPEEVI